MLARNQSRGFPAFPIPSSDGQSICATGRPALRERMTDCERSADQKSVEGHVDTRMRAHILRLDGRVLCTFHLKARLGHMRGLKNRLLAPRQALRREQIRN